MPLNGSGTVQGSKDHDKDIQIEFWERAAREGFTDESSRASAQKFRAEFEELDKRLAKHPYLMGDDSERARHRLVYLCAPAFARRVSVRAAASARQRLGRTGFERVRSSQGKSRCRRKP